MLKVINNDIYFNRGEAVALDFKIWNTDGTPFVLPPLGSVRNLRSIATVEKNAVYFYEPFFIGVGNTAKEVYVYSRDNDGVIRLFLADGDGLDVVEGENLVSTNRPISYIYGNVEMIAWYETDDYAHTMRPDSGLVSAVVLTVRSSTYDKVVLTKVLNMCAPTVWARKVDSAPFGWNKFASEKVTDAAQGYEEATQGIHRIFRYDSNPNAYFHSLIKRGENFSIYDEPYEFELEIPILPQDTQDLQAGEYTYDLIAYQGEVKGPEVFAEDYTEFPFKLVHWKKELIAPHKFVIGDSHNA